VLLLYLTEININGYESTVIHGSTLWDANPLYKDPVTVVRQGNQSTSRKQGRPCEGPSGESRNAPKHEPEDAVIHMFADTALKGPESPEGHLTHPEKIARTQK